MQLTRIRSLIFFPLLAALAACDTPRSEVLPAKEEPLVLLIGVDGLSPDALGEYPAPNIRALAERGVQAESLIPVMPTVTFPNFYTLATGLYPEVHGIVSNTPYDRSFRERMNIRESAGESRWWGGEPIWVSAEKQGLRTAILFWLGSEAEIRGYRPSTWFPYQHDKPYPERVRELLSWFDRPESERPRFAAIYFDAVDSAGHRFGPGTREEGEAVARVDQTIGEIIAGLEQRHLLPRANIVLVSDHGMVRVEPDQVIAIERYADFSELHLPEFGERGGFRPFVSVFGEGEPLERAYHSLKSAHPRMQVYKRGEMPPHFRFDHPQRGPDLFILTEPGWSLSYGASEGATPPFLGMHGYDSTDPRMHGAFIAAGPSFPQGARVPAFENVHVYLMMACALGIEPAQTAGDPSLIRQITQGRCTVKGE